MPQVQGELKTVEVVKISVPAYANKKERYAAMEYLAELLENEGIKRKDALTSVSLAFHYLHEEMVYNGLPKVKSIIDY